MNIADSDLVTRAKATAESRVAAGLPGNAARPAPQVAQCAVRRHHVLVIDDDDVVSRHVAWHLGQQDYRVSCAASGAEALARIAADLPDVIVLDHYLPDTTGEELLQALRRDQASSAIPVIYLTIDASHRRIRKSMTGGADDFLAKPVAAADLVDAVRAQLRKAYVRMFRPDAGGNTSDAEEVAHLAQELDLVQGRLRSVCEDCGQSAVASGSSGPGGEAGATAQVRALERQNSALKAYGYALAHELRRPLRGILGFTGLLMDYEAGMLCEESARMLERIETSGRRMNEFVESLLSMAAAERRNFRRTRLDLSEMARDIFDNGCDLPATRPADVRISPALVADADPVLARIALENLFSNAFKYSSKIPHPVIAFDVCDMGGEQVFFVRDNGVGFDMKDAQRMFEPFQRLHSTVDYDGLGIGLATVQQIIERHNGRIWARSAAGEGATFFFTMAPAFQAAPRP